jgi:enoyl-CoA hydratase/carnithine racemase
MESASTLVRRRRAGHVLVITLDRPEKRNAVNRAMADQLDEALNELDDDRELWAGVLTGTPEMFSAGSDLTSGGDYMTDRGGEYGIIRRQRHTPLIAAVEGFALGGGLEIVLSCDMVVASSAARFGLPEVSIGVIPTCAGLFRGPRALPRHVARQLVLTGRPLDAVRAYELGLVNLLSPPGQAEERAVELAQEVCSNAPVSVQACLVALNELESESDAKGWEATTEAMATVMRSADSREGVSAFLEKRPPVWTGR